MTTKSCPNCGGPNTKFELVSFTTEKRKHRNIIAWLLFWWWFEIILWFFLTIPRLLIAIFFPKRKKQINHTKTVMLCQDCGYHR